MSVKQYRKKPAVVEAMQYDGNNGDEIKGWMGSAARRKLIIAPEYLLITTLEGSMKADIGDWIIKGVAGEFYPCKTDIFKRTYEVVQ